MKSRYEFKFDKNTLFLISIVFVSLLIRFLVVNYRYVINNDEVIYFNVARNLFLGKGFTEDGINPHLLFHPLYPFYSLSIYYFSKSFELASKLNFVLFGGTICVPLYYLAKRIYNVRVARLSVLIMVFLPSWLLSNHLWSAASEQMYTLMFIAGILIFYNAILSGRLLLFGLSSMLFTLCYLARPEAIAFPLVGIALIFIIYFTKFFKSAIKVRLRVVKKLLAIVVFILIFILCASPYLLFLKNNLGYWTVSPKLGWCLTFAKQNPEAFDYRRPDGTLLWDESDSSFEVLAKRYACNLGRLAQSFFHIGFFPFYLLPFLIIGFLKDRQGTEGRLTKFILLMFFIPTYLEVAAIYVKTRYLMPTLPILIMWISNGMYHSEVWLALRLKAVGRARMFVNLMITMLILVLIISTLGMVHFLLANPIEYKELGLWIQRNLPQDAKIINRCPILSFYAERETVGYPDDLTRPRNILKYAKENNARYLAVDDIKWRSMAFPKKEWEYLLSVIIAPKPFKRIYENHTYGRRVVLYEIY